MPGSMTAADFEQRYQREADPWGYRSSAYEREKYEATLQACGPGPFRAALELGGSIGVFTARLAPQCVALTTVDFAPTAVGAARRLLRPHGHVSVLLGEVPGAIPDGAYDLVVASEVLYYLEPPALAATTARLREVLAPGGRLVAVHWRTDGPERPQSALEAHDHLRAATWLRTVEDCSTPDYLLHVLER